MRVACLIFLFALLAAWLAKPQPGGRQASTSRFAIVRISVLLVRLAGLQIRMGMLMIHYGALVVLGAIIAAIRRRSRSSLARQQPPQTDDSGLKYRQCAAPGWPCRGDTAHSQFQARVRQRAAPYRSRLNTKQKWQAPNRRERALRQASTHT